MRGPQGARRRHKAAGEANISEVRPQKSRTRPRRRTRPWTLAASVILSGVFLVFTFVDVSLHNGELRWKWVLGLAELAHAVERTSVSDIGVFALLTLLTLPVRAWRWGLLVHPGGRFRDRYQATAIGFMAVNLLPARLGEVVRGLSLARRVPHLSKAQAVGSVFLARFFDLVALWICCLPLAVVLPLGREAKAALVVGLGSGFCAIGASVLVLALLNRRGEGFRAWLSGRIGRRGALLLSRFFDGLSSSLGRRDFVFALIASIAGQVLSALAYGPLVVHAAPGTNALWGTLFVLAVISIGLAIPSSPSGIGVYHFALMWALRALGAHPADSLAVAVVTHLGSVIVFVGAGVVSLLFDRPRTLDVLDEARETSSDASKTSTLPRATK